MVDQRRDEPLHTSDLPLQSLYQRRNTRWTAWLMRISQSKGVQHPAAFPIRGGQNFSFEQEREIALSVIHCRDRRDEAVRMGLCT